MRLPFLSGPLSEDGHLTLATLFYICSIGKCLQRRRKSRPRVRTYWHWLSDLRLAPPDISGGGGEGAGVEKTIQCGGEELRYQMLWMRADGQGRRRVAGATRWTATAGSLRNHA